VALLKNGDAILGYVSPEKFGGVSRSGRLPQIRF
jgi:hypothetical protein